MKKNRASSKDIVDGPVVAVKNETATSRPKKYYNNLIISGQNCITTRRSYCYSFTTLQLLTTKSTIMGIIKNDHSEGKLAKKIEKQTAKLPSDLFLWAAVGSMAASATLKIMGKKTTSLFVGQWATSFLLLGIYNKIVKVEGSDADDKPGN